MKIPRQNRDTFK